VKKRLNYTGRRTLSAEQVEIRVNEGSGEKNPTFTAAFDLTSLSGLDTSAKVYVEPYVRSSSMRFDFGTIGVPSTPADTALSELDAAGSLLFRVKIVDESASVGRILAHASGIRPRNPEDEGPSRKSILPLCITDTGQEIWRLAYNPDSGPVLEISNKIVGLAARIKADPLLQGAIYPHALRVFLNQFLGENEPETGLKWVDDWHRFLKALTGRDLQEDELDEDEVESFTDDAVKTFLDVNGFASKAAKHEEEAHG
jgi:hypothetical protein